MRTVDANGNVTAVWRESTNDPRAIRANRFTGGSWTGAVALETNDSGATNPALAVDDSGNSMAIWTAGAGLSASFFSTAGGSWSTETALDSTNSGQDNPDVAFAHGCPKALAVRKDLTGANSEIDSAFFQ